MKHTPTKRRYSVIAVVGYAEFITDILKYHLSVIQVRDLIVVDIHQLRVVKLQKCMMSVQDCEALTVDKEVLMSTFLLEKETIRGFTAMWAL
jgi:hypothetical protein